MQNRIQDIVYTTSAPQLLIFDDKNRKPSRPSVLLRTRRSISRQMARKFVIGAFAPRPKPEVQVHSRKPHTLSREELHNIATRLRQTSTKII